MFLGGYGLWKRNHEHNQNLKLYPFRYISSSDFRSIEITRGEEHFSLMSSEGEARSENKSSFLGVTQPDDGDYIKKVLDPEVASNWRYNGVKGAVLEPSPLNFLVNTLHSLELSQSVDKDKVSPDLSVYGIINPTLILRLKTTHGMEELRFGALNEFLGLRYLKLASRSEIYLIIEQLFNAANRNGFDFRPKRALQFGLGELESFSVKRPEGDITFKPEGENWKMSDPPYRLNQSAFGELYREISTLSIKDYSDPSADNKELNLKASSIFVTLYFLSQSRGPVELAIEESRVGAQGELVASKAKLSTAASVFNLEPTPLISLHAPINSFRSVHPFEIPTLQVEQIIIKGKDLNAIELKRRDGAWHSAGKIFITERVNSLVGLINSIKVAEFPESDPGEEALHDPALEVELKISLSDGGARSVTRRLIVAARSLNTKPHQLFAALDNKKDIVILTEEIVAKLKAAIEALGDQVNPNALTLTPSPTPSIHTEEALKAKEQSRGGVATFAE